MGNVQALDCLIKVDSPIRETILAHMLEQESFDTTNVEVWVYPSFGFAATLLETCEGINTLHIQYAIGLNMYKSHGMNMLRKLAIEMKCSRVTGVANGPIAKRLLSRLGFFPIKDNYMELKLYG